MAPLISISQQAVSPPPVSLPPLATDVRLSSTVSSLQTSLEKGVLGHFRSEIICLHYICLTQWGARQCPMRQRIYGIVGRAGIQTLPATRSSCGPWPGLCQDKQEFSKKSLGGFRDCFFKSSLLVSLIYRLPGRPPRPPDPPEPRPRTRTDKMQEWNENKSHQVRVRLQVRPFLANEDWWRTGQAVWLEAGLDLDELIGVGPILLTTTPPGVVWGGLGTIIWASAHLVWVFT